VRGHASKLLESYLSERSQAIRIGKEITEYTQINCGIGQGSNLGGLLFNIKLNDFMNLPLKCQPIRFADDVALLTSAPATDFASIERNLIHDVKVVSNYHRINGMSINAGKSKFMLIHKKSAKQLLPIDKLKIDELTSLERVNEYKYLGAIIDENLSFESHTTRLANKIRPAVNALSILKWHVPTSILTKIYQAHIQSHLFYIPFLYGQAKAENLREIQVLQNRALKHSLKLPALTSTESLFTNHAKTILPVSGIICYSLMVFLFKCLTQIIDTDICPPFTTTSRNGVQFRAVSFSSDFLKRDFSYYGVKVFNKMPSEIRSLTSIHKFKLEVKKFLLERSSQLLSPSKCSLLALSQ
jgi:hypothetical protein